MEGLNLPITRKPYTIIDVETTGGVPAYSRITEIAAFVWEDGVVVDEFSSLVNPQMPIPPFITQLTGISDEMVEGAPTFDRVLGRIKEMTEGTVFVAHNVNFDYGVIRSEFHRYGDRFDRERLCTVRLAKKYLPGHSSYSLGTLCGTLGIPIHGRHRARGDAEATVELFARIFQAADGKPTMRSGSWVQKLPPQLNRQCIDELPEEPGVLYVMGEGDRPLYITGAKNLYKEAVRLVSRSGRRSVEMKSQIHDIACEAHPSVLVSLVKAADEIIRQKPIYNPRSPRKAWSPVIEPGMFGESVQIVAGDVHTNCMYAQASKAQVEKFLAGRPADTGELCRFLSRSFVALDKGGWFLYVEGGQYLGYGCLDVGAARQGMETARQYTVMDKYPHLLKITTINKYLASNKVKLVSVDGSLTY